MGRITPSAYVRFFANASDTTPIDNPLTTQIVEYSGALVGTVMSATVYLKATGLTVDTVVTLNTTDCTAPASVTLPASGDAVEVNVTATLAGSGLFQAFITPDAGTTSISCSTLRLQWPVTALPPPPPPPPEPVDPPANFLNVLPDASTPFVERLEWFTDVKTTWDGTTWRRALRFWPRISFTGEYRFAPEFAETRYIGNADTEALFEKLNAGFIVNPGLFGSLTQTVVLPVPVHLNSAALGDAQTAQKTGGQLVMRWLKNRKTPVFIDGTAPRPSDWLLDMPLYEGYIASDRSIEHVTSAYKKLQLTLTVKDQFIEDLPDASGLDLTASTGPLKAVLRANWLNGIREAQKAAVDVYDNRQIQLQRVRYVKRMFEVDLALVGRDAIRDFRAFLFAVAGRYGQFGFNAPIFTPEDRFYLANDVVDIEYVGWAYARVKLQIEKA